MAMENGKADRSLVVSFGEMLIDFLQMVIGISLAGASGFVKATPGFVIAITHPDGRSAFVDKLGDDEFGRMLVRILHDNDIIDVGIMFDSGACIALTFVTLRADGWMWNE